jgi:exosortase A-associated hydrolase 1
MFDERALAFPCENDWLYGVLSLPALPSRRAVLIVVGGPQVRTGSHRQFTLLARSLAQAGIAAMRFDYRGMGDSEGAARDFERVQTDLRAAVDCLCAELPKLEEVVLWGLCDGASAAAMYAPADRRVSALALLNPWVRSEAGEAKARLKHYYGDRLLDPSLWRKIARGRFDFVGAARSFARIARAAFASRPAQAEAPLPERVRAALQAFEGKVLVMLSGADLTAQEFGEVTAASRDWQRLLAEARFTQQRLPKADHTCSRRAWHEQMVRWTADWLRSW